MTGTPTEEVESPTDDNVILPKNPVLDPCPSSASETESMDIQQATRSELEYEVLRLKRALRGNERHRRDLSKLIYIDCSQS